MSEGPSAPACIGIIMDGNRRWARANNLPAFAGHSEGYTKLQEVMRWVREAGIPHVVAYAFSTENWQRSAEEVGYMLKLFRSILESETQKMVDERVRVRFIGDRARFDEDLQKMMEKLEAETAQAYDVTLHLLMSYGGRAEIVAAARSAAAQGGEITEDTFARQLWTAEMPDPDLVIRTGGEKRLSNFLPWQSVYSELFFTDTLWPACTKEEFEQILTEYRARKRNFGI